jgi:hypothetical protein
LVCLKAKKSIQKSNLDIFPICVESMYCSSFFNWEYEISQIFLKFKTFGMKFWHLEQKLEWSNQNMCKKFLKNNAHIYLRYSMPKMKKILLKTKKVSKRCFGKFEWTKNGHVHATLKTSRGKWGYMKRKIVWAKVKHSCYFWVKPYLKLVSFKNKIDVSVGPVFNIAPFSLPIRIKCWF